MQPNETCLRIDKANAKAMIDGLWKDGKFYHQSIWLTTRGSIEDYPKLLILQKDINYKLSPIGKKLNAKNFKMPYKYIAELDSQYFVDNKMELWGKICSNGLFDIWDPEGGPCQRFAQSNLANSRIQLLRIYEIDHEFNENDITKPANHRNIPKLILPIPEVKKIRSVITDEEFRELKELLKHSVKHYLTRPPQYFVSASEKTPLTIDTITNEDIELLESEYDGFSEGRLLIRAHKLRERNPQASIQKKKNVLKKTGTLACEVCCFDFHAIYGELGRNFAECHHRIPLCELVESNTTKLEDLAIVCANCHRMLHKARPWKTVEELKKIIKGE